MSIGSDPTMSPPTLPSPNSSSRSASPSHRTPPNLHQNSIDPDAPWLVQKFGGTSVGKFPVKIARDIVSQYIDSHKVAIVCSARSSSTKALGTTSLLLRAASQVLRPKRSKNLNGSSNNTPLSRGLFSLSGPDNSGSQTPPPATRESTSTDTSPNPATPSSPFSLIMVPRAGQLVPDYNVTVDLLMHEHLRAARTVVVRDLKLLKELEEEIEKDCDWLRGFLAAANIINEISPRSKDSIVGLGERLACKIMTAAMRDQGIDAEYVSLEDIIPETPEWEGMMNMDNASLDQAFYDKLAIVVGERIRQCGPRVPVVTGFFGAVPGSLLDQVGRGYTDLLSALLAVGVGAAELQIWKEVDGIFTADPRKVYTARLLSVISPDEAAELTYYGSEVVHPFTMEQVVKKKIPIRIKNVENPMGRGTLISPDPDADIDLHTEVKQSQDLIDKPLALFYAEPANGHIPHFDYPHPKLPTAVTIKENVIVLNVNSNRKSVSHGFLAGIFAALDRFGIVVDLISTSEVHVSMAISASGISTRVLDRLVSVLERNGPVSVDRDRAILSLVGRKMKNMVGIAGRMFTTLAQAGVNIDMISQGASEINISCVIAARDAVKALNVTHQSCLQIRPEGATGRLGPWLF